MGNFSNLPSDIMLEIFTRLPTESVLESKLVCKTWRNVVGVPSFAQMHSNVLLSKLHSAAADCGKLSFIVNDLSQEFHYLEYDDESSSHRVKKMNFNAPLENYIFLGSCNGLICLIGLPKHYPLSESSTVFVFDVPYICNPITREILTLPELDRSKYYGLVGEVFYGFGYVASTKEYKVVRFYTFKRDPEVAQIDVYALGSGKGWRKAGTIRSSAGFSNARDGLFANGYVYCDFGNGRTAVYDLADETFVGDSDFPDNHFSLGVVTMRGHLYGIDYSEDTKSSDIWLLKKNEDKSFGWCKEFSLISEDSYNTPFAFTSNGTVLGYSYTKLYLYDLKSTSSKVLQDLRSRIFYARRHVNTLVSLKAFGEENTTTLE